MKRLLLLTLLCGTFVSFTALAPSTSYGPWKLLGKRTVNWSVDHDVIHVTRARGDWSKIQIKVFRSAVHFRDVKVHFRNGGVQDIKIRKLIPAGGQTRVIDLNGADRVIHRISFWYDTAGPIPRKRALVKVHGRR